jgi:3-deoxy-D-manno-octulosonate 8-phosphate phosphatase (KDO 8-P phosphatase)
MRAKTRARRVKMVLMDVDGTMTDGLLTVFPDGDEIKSYDVKDGLGILLAQLAGLKLGIITGKTSKGLEKRAERLKISELHQGALNKKPVFDDILARHRLSPEEIAYIGDDLGDLEIMKAVGFAGAVRDAHPFIKKRAHYVCARDGGRGAVREFLEFIIGAQKKWEMVIAGFKTIFNRKI